MKYKKFNLTIIGILLICLGIVSNNLSGILLTNEDFYNDSEININPSGIVELLAEADIFTQKTKTSNINVYDYSGAIPFLRLGLYEFTYDLGGYISEIYVRFNLPKIENINSMVLQLSYWDGYPIEADDDYEVNASLVSNDWVETTTIWTERPEYLGTSTLIYLNNPGLESEVFIDLMSLVEGLTDTTITIHLCPNNLSRIRFPAPFKSTESHGITPKLILEFDDSPPDIIINSPISNELFGTTAPYFNVEIYDANLDSMWYTLDNGLTNTTFTTNGTINQSAWDALPDGNIIIKFYSNDSAGNIGFDEVSVVKDATAPTIVINSPTDGEEFGNNVPSFNIVVTDDHLDMIWYSFDGGLTTYTTNTSFNQLAWSALPEGNITITFYANDTLGNEASEYVTVVKEISQPSLPEIPGYNILLLLGIVSTIAVIIVKKRLNHLN
jgi:hypothetical protein